MNLQYYSYEEDQVYEYDSEIISKITEKKNSFDLTSKFLTYKLGSVACQLGDFIPRSNNFVIELDAFGIRSEYKVLQSFVDSIGIKRFAFDDVNQVCW